jgi:hypothetical protein
MKIMDVLHYDGRPAILSECSRDDLPQFFVDMGYKTGVELGVYAADFTEKFAKIGLTIYGIDPWIWYPGGGHSSQRGQNKRYLLSLEKVSAYENCHLIRKTSAEALKDFEDESLDFIYIDADHSFPHIAHDIFYWEKKVRKGGIVSGHDYFNTRSSASVILCHVGAVVDAYTKLFKIENWYVLNGIDRTISWMWVK